MSAALTLNEIMVAIAVAALSASKRMTASCSYRGEPEGHPGPIGVAAFLLPIMLKRGSRAWQLIR
jgi:hypothetical protein